MREFNLLLLHQSFQGEKQGKKKEEEEEEERDKEKRKERTRRHPNLELKTQRKRLELQRDQIARDGAHDGGDLVRVAAQCLRAPARDSCQRFARETFW
jgi:hypothetical protein